MKLDRILPYTLAWSVLVDINIKYVQMFHREDRLLRRQRNTQDRYQYIKFYLEF
jgi:hypothetical protein